MKYPIRKAAEILRKDGVVAFPTETVYGLGARLFSPKGVRKIYSVKGRPSDNPLIVHISEMSQLELLAEDVSSEARDLIRKFWPGPLTLVFKKSSLVPKLVTAGLETVAIRMPAHPTARQLIQDVGEPVAAPSANRSGRPSGTQYADVKKELGGRADFILPGGPAKFGLESTVIDATKIPFRILRPGSVTLENLRRVFPRIIARHANSVRGAAPSPGMKHRHYQPSCKVVLVESKNWNQALKRWSLTDRNLGCVSFSRRIPLSSKSGNVVFSRFFTKEKDYARSLYRIFFEAEKKSVDVLLIEKRPEKGLGLAIMDRLKRASA